MFVIDQLQESNVSGLIHHPAYSYCFQLTAENAMYQAPNRLMAYDMDTS